METTHGISTFKRAETFQRITTETFDVLIIGGGITGAGIALDAASRNLKVLLVEKQDFAAGTSSRSTKLIHGGLRYLKNFEFSLVRTVARERHILHLNAPHLVIPEKMLLPVLKTNSFGFWATAAGLTLYECLGNVQKTERHQMLSKTKTLAQEPLLNPENLIGSGIFYEYRTDDARLTLEVLKTAQSLGAICLNYIALNNFTYASENKINGGIIQDQLSGKSTTVKARCVINAAGPWSGELMKLDTQQKTKNLFHTKGVHLVIPFRKLPLNQAVYFDISGGRMLFAIPRKNCTYLGTTDTPFSGKLENPEVTKQDATYILTQINQMFPQACLTISDIISSWAGIRPLIFEAGKKPSEISRKDEIIQAQSGLISIAGGKLTGYRKLAEKVINKAVKQYFPSHKKSSQTKNIKLSAGNFKDSEAVEEFRISCQHVALEKGLPIEKIDYLVSTYGRNTGEILEKAAFYLTDKLCPEKGLLKAEIWYTITTEGATSLSDFLIRRTGKLYFEKETIEAILPDTTSYFQEFLSWNEQLTQHYTSEFNALFKATVTFKAG